MEEERRIREMLLSKAVDYLPEACQLNDNMARNPEIGSQEYNSSSAIVELLRKYGIETEYPFAGFATAFKGIINPKKEKRMAVLAEYDALRGMGHACGHCASGSASVMAALAFHSVEDQLPFGVDIIGTPDEEIIGVKCLMADQGIFDGYDFAIMVHMGGASMIDVNFIALDGLQFIWHGASAHAASAPEQGRNALNAARLFMDATDMMRQHIIQEARIHGVIRDGGIASNIVPDRAEVEFLTRAPKRAQLNDITQWVKECAQAAAMATRTQVDQPLWAKRPGGELSNPRSPAGTGNRRDDRLIGHWQCRLPLPRVPSHHGDRQGGAMPYAGVCGGDDKTKHPCSNQKFRRLNSYHGS